MLWEDGPVQPCPQWVAALILQRNRTHRIQGGRLMKVDLWELAYMVMEAVFFPDVFSASWKSRETMAQPKSEGL